MCVPSHCSNTTSPSQLSPCARVVRSLSPSRAGQLAELLGRTEYWGHTEPEHESRLADPRPTLNPRMNRKRTNTEMMSQIIILPGSLAIRDITRSSTPSLNLSMVPMMQPSCLGHTERCTCNAMPAGRCGAGKAMSRETRTEDELQLYELVATPSYYHLLHIAVCSHCFSSYWHR